MLTLYNTMTRSKEPFMLQEEGVAKMFTCGPSIYRPPHIGNYRTFIWEDVLQRYLSYLGLNVRRVINFTDVEDKAIEEAQELGEPIEGVTGANAKRFLEEARLLRIGLPEYIPRSSTSVEQAVRLILILIEKGYAYRHKGDIFFDPLKFEGFGRLFRLDMNRWPKQKKRFKRDTYPGQRWNLGDFILWHGCKEGDTVCWDTEIGKGRPSWNIQDPAMISSTLGYSLDIFCGGIDNIYRHHDYNIAVMEAASGVPLAGYWLHGQHVLVNGKKMSKSLNNIIYPRDLADQGFSWEEIRFYLMSRHYRKKLDIDVNEMRVSANRLKSLRNMVSDLTRTQPKKSLSDRSVTELTEDLTASFEAGMNDDLDTPAALEGLSGALQRLYFLHKIGKIGKSQASTIDARLKAIDSVIQVLF